MNKDLDEGTAKLKDFNGKERFDVEYSIAFVTTLIPPRRPGLPPMPRLKATVNYIRAVNGEVIPAGEYWLHRPSEINRVEYLDGAGWYVLSPF